MSRFVGNVAVGRDVSIDELLDLYDAVILATGAPHDRKLGIPGEDLPGVVGSAEFVGWYNGHPDFADLDPPLDGTHAAVIGNGNVALDCARILVQDARRVRRLGHRRPCARRARRVGDPHDHHPRPARPAPDRDDAQGTGRARPSRGGGARSSMPPISRRSRPTRRSSPASASRSPSCASSPTLEPTRPSPSDGLRLLRQAACDRGRRPGRAAHRRAHRLDESGGARGTGETYEMPAGLVVSCIGYSTPPIEGVPYDEQRRPLRQRRRPDRRPALLRRLGAARADRHDRHQPARRL